MKNYQKIKRLTAIAILFVVIGSVGIFNFTSNSTNLNNCLTLSNIEALTEDEDFDEFNPPPPLDSHGIWLYILGEWVWFDATR